MLLSTTLVGLQLVMLMLTPRIESKSSSEEQQRFKIWLAKKACDELLLNATKPDDGGLYCPPVWDNIMCWPNYTKAGQTVGQNCASYITGFLTTAKAWRYCEEDGRWQRHPDDRVNSSWTNFTFCHESDVPQVLLNMYNIRKISSAGYSVSLVCLVVATSIMVFLKRLHCQRNTIHINLFISFILRAVLSLLVDSVLENGFLPKDVIVRNDGIKIFDESGPHWECKLLTTLHQYSLGVNYMWIFVEGLYLHTLVFFSVFSQSKKFFKIYIIIGWVFPLLNVIAWVLVRIYANNTFCWNTHDFGYYWILNAPIVISIIINFIFFLNIIRMLFTKIRNTNSGDPGRYKKLAKSTLVLIPLFGVYYIYFIIVTYHKDYHFSVIHLYMEMTLNSFQGTVIAFLFCFLNGEVRAEIMKKWNRHWLRRQSVVSSRSSRAFSTTSFYIGRDRASVSQGPGLPDILYRDGFAVTPPSSPSNNNNASKVHKVASMPKMPFWSTSLPKPIPRVASSPKVTFSCSEFITDNVNLSVGGSSPKMKNGILTNGVTRGNSDEDEKKTLLTNGSPPSRKDSIDSNGHRVQKVRESVSPMLRGGNSEGSPHMSHVCSAPVLPPLLDEDEENSETTQML
ncbi:secretin receptor [Biomphalaria glabrata]|uniref:Secretin receptor-like n=1 Tax=Biomphalaria glabrata TaxID=6526 RepID=A0A9W3ASU9_BIOGL|nr:secretin receptor-like [Biomphalaria glabrata]XP_055890315.1 secretin receptor-like [Biomphalaria glabrata]XP_055890322.1 secretin receptor-like [Biomphalaria glabrata]